MFEFLKSLFIPDPKKKITKEIERLYKQAVSFQRNGNLREYARVIKEIEDLEKEYSEV